MWRCKVLNKQSSGVMTFILNHPYTLSAGLAR
jgi:hypothetical protein